jgi:anti-sigma B factor antagonist
METSPGGRVETQAREREVQDGTLTLRVSEESSMCTLALAGELDLANAARVSAELERLETSGVPVRIDLSELEFIDSTGIAILVAAHKRLENRLQVVPSPAPVVRRVLDITGLGAKLPIAPLDGR